MKLFTCSLKLLLVFTTWLPNDYLYSENIWPIYTIQSQEAFQTLFVDGSGAMTKTKSTLTSDEAPEHCWCRPAWRWSWGTGWRGSEGTSSLRSSPAHTGLPCQGEYPPPASPQLQTKTDKQRLRFHRRVWKASTFFPHSSLWISYHRLVFCQAGWPQSAADLHKTSWGVWTWAQRCQLLGHIYRNMAGLEWASRRLWRSFEAGQWNSCCKSLDKSAALTWVATSNQVKCKVG